MKLLLTLFLLLANPLFAQSSFGSTIVESDSADYQGNELVLSGHVQISHEIGRICAGKIVVDAGEKEIHLFTMSDEVNLFLKEGGKLHCFTAQLDTSKGWGQFLGKEGIEQVSYTDERTQPNGRKLSLSLTTPRIDLEFNPLSSKSPKTFKSFEAYAPVTITYNKVLKASSHKAIYLPNKNLSLYPHNAEEPCFVTFADLATIESQRIDINPLHQTVFFDSPSGQLNLFSTTETSSPLQFSSKQMEWNDSKHLLILQDHVKISHPMGHLLAEDKVELTMGEDDVKQIQCSGKTDLSYSKEPGSLASTLTCFGQILIDKERSHISLESPSLGSKIATEQQITFRDDFGRMHCDKMNISYTLLNNQFVINKISLLGHIRLLKMLASEGREENPSFYALADYVDIFPQTGIVHLKAGQGRRVLFFDIIKKSQMSAQEITFCRDPATGKESIKGHGHIRLIFDESELKQFSKHFSLVSGHEEETSSK